MAMAQPSTFYWRAGALLGATAFGLGAFGAHALSKHVGNDPNKIKNWAIAAQYQLMHAVVLLVISSIPRSVRPVNPFAAPLILGGTIIFSGSIYLLTFNRERFRFLGPTTPLGGTAVLAGWVALLL